MPMSRYLNISKISVGRVGFDMKRSVLCLICLTVSSLLLTSCAKEMRGDLTCQEIGDEAISAIGGDFAPMGEELLLLIFDGDAPYDDYAIYASTPTEDIDEIGIFRAENRKDAERIAETLEEYVNETADGMRSFVASYAPEEAKKLDSVVTFVVGNYAVYMILDKSDSEKVKARISECLTED